jgi:hypothetical protein
MLRPAEKQELFRDGRLPRIDMGDDADVSNICEVTSHKTPKPATSAAIQQPARNR